MAQNANQQGRIAQKLQDSDLDARQKAIIEERCNDSGTSGEIDLQFIEGALDRKYYWAIDLQYSGWDLDIDIPAHVQEIRDVLEMWDTMLHSYNKLSADERTEVNGGNVIYFIGFQSESQEHYIIADYLLNKVDNGFCRNIRGKIPTSPAGSLEAHRKMYEKYKPFYDYATTGGGPIDLSAGMIDKLFPRKGTEIDFERFINVDFDRLPKQFGNKEEAMLRQKALQNIDSLRKHLTPGNHARFGHNNPPPEFTFDQSEIREMEKALDAIEDGLRNYTPKPKSVAQESFKIQKFLKNKNFRFWGGVSILTTGGQFVDGLFEEFFKQLGLDVINYTAAQLLEKISPLWEKLLSLLASVYEWLVLLQHAVL